MSFVVIGRPPGANTCEHVRCNDVPYDTLAAAKELQTLLMAQGWLDLEICRFLGDDDVRPFIPAKATP